MNITKNSVNKAVEVLFAIFVITIAIVLSCGVFAICYTAYAE